MAKSELTRKLEQVLYRWFDYRKEFICHEVTIGFWGSEIVDLISVDTKGEIKCFEIKSTKQDFYNKKAKLSFVGNKNYFVMSLELYEQVKQDIPKDIGVYAASEEDILNSRYKKVLSCVKRAKRKELEIDKETILLSMIRSMQREILKAKRRKSLI
jgi:hypothetical protein